LLINWYEGKCFSRAFYKVVYKIDEEEVISAAKSAVENRGIIFIDEFDKLIEGKGCNY
jgi:ATP-dependent protease HslVU (ClpYQ) ATPase subunit